MSKIIRCIANHLLYACVALTSTSVSSNNEFQLPVKAEQVTSTKLAQEWTAVGNLLANESVAIASELSGKIKTITFQEGQHVTAGSVLFTLDADDYAAQFQESQASVSLQQQRYQRLLELVKKNYASKQAVDEGRDTLAEAQAKARYQASRLAKTVIKAPFSGKVGLRSVSPGAFVEPGKTLVYLEDDDTLKLDFQLPEHVIPFLQIGQKIHLRVDALPGQAFEGQVYATEPMLNQQTRSLRVRAKVSNADHALKSGMFAHISLPSAKQEWLLVSEQALVPQGTQLFVYRVIEGKAKLTPVKTGLRRDGKVAITEGLSVGDQVITDGQIKLQDGMAVMIVGESRGT